MLEDLRENYQNDIKGHQYVLLRILKIVANICKENKIDYWIDSGTLLGAIRHKGFIPWDDDIDIGILRKDEKRFINVMQNNLPKDLFLQTKETDPGICIDYIKIRDKYSSILETEKNLNHEGIYIDVFIFDDIKKHTSLEKIIRKLPAKFYREETGIKARIKKILLNILKIFKISSFKELRIKLYKIISKDISKNDALIYFQGIEYWNTFYKKDIFPLREVEFENYKFFAPKNPKAILIELYGKNYMQLPPLSKRMTHTIGINLTKPCNHKEILYWDTRKGHSDE